MNFIVYLNVLFQQAGRARRSHPEDMGHVTTKGSVERTSPAVAASDRRKSLKLVRGRYKKRRENAFVLLLTGPSPHQDCLLGSARCVLFQCPLHSFSGQAILKIHARLWNSSFIEVKDMFHLSVLGFKFQQALIFLKPLRTSV